MRILIRFEINEEVRRQFKALCARNGTTMSAALRGFIWYSLGLGRIGHDIAPPTPPQEATQ